MKIGFKGKIAENEFYHIEVRPPLEFKRFRVERVGYGIKRVGGQCENGVWNTVKWLVSKKLAHIENDRLIADDQAVRELFNRLDSPPKYIKGDFFEAKNILTQWNDESILIPER